MRSQAKGRGLEIPAAGFSPREGKTRLQVRLLKGGGESTGRWGFSSSVLSGIGIVKVRAVEKGREIRVLFRLGVCASSLGKVAETVIHT